MGEEAPVIDPTWDWIWEAWWRLHNGDRRSLVQGLSAPLGGTVIRSEPDFLPWTVVRQWAREHRLSQSSARLLDECVQAMDETFRKWWFEANKVQ